MSKSSNVDKVIDELLSYHSNPKCELNFNSTFELLVAVILSAQCTDKRVNVVTKELFAVANTPEQFAIMELEDLEKIIFPCGFYHNKAKHIISASQDILTRFDGKVPDNLDDLMTLSGVGRKTANVVYAVGFNGQAIAVDTHVFRVAHRIGWSKGKTPLDVEHDLMHIIPKDKWSLTHHLLIHQGRYVCKSRCPACDICPINAECDSYNSSKKKLNKI